MSAIHPELASRARFIPSVPASPTVVSALKWLTRVSRTKVARGVAHERRAIAGPKDNPSVVAHVFRPENPARNTPALLWMHGGGYLIGNPMQDAFVCSHFASALGITVVAVQYRLAPEHRYPAAVEDCYAALRWMHETHASLSIDRDRIAIGGASAGGGLTAALALLARDREGPKPAFQLLVYPMLDDRTALREDLDESNFRLWKQSNNRYGWRSYLGREPGSDGVEIYAAAGRCESLEGLCPAWLGVGTLDLFYDEDTTYARRLNEQGIRCQIDVVDGAFHGFDLAFPSLGVSTRFRDAQTEALRRALAL
ncbi:MAG: alpha/beta hydrolase [Polyangiales bacterium]